MYLSKYRPIPLRRLTDIQANPDIITLQEARIIRENEIARREIIRIGLSPYQILLKHNLLGDDINDLFE